MKRKVQIGRACGKVNLHLNVFGRRPDGYHEIISIFRKINLADELVMKVAWDDPSIQEPEVRVKGLEGLGVEEGADTLTRAVRFWCRRRGVPARVEIGITKRIPAGSGLGGGSSDAAWALMALDQIFSWKADPGYLAAAAAEVGADVPFFLSGCGAAVVEGVGEVVTPLPEGRNWFGHILVPNNRSGTSGAYRRLDELGLRPRTMDRGELEAMYNRPIAEWRFANDFEKVVPPPRIQVPKGAFYSLTGSGSAAVLLNSFFPPFKAEFDGEAIPVLLL